MLFFVLPQCNAVCTIIPPRQFSLPHQNSPLHPSDHLTMPMTLTMTLTMTVTPYCSHRPPRPCDWWVRYWCYGLSGCSIVSLVFLAVLCLRPPSLLNVYSDSQAPWIVSVPTVPQELNIMIGLSWHPFFPHQVGCMVNQPGSWHPFLLSLFSSLILYKVIY